MSAALKIISSIATSAVLAELGAQYRLATGQAVSAETAGGVDVARRVEAGEALDIVVLAANVIDQLIGKGRLVAGSRVDLARSGVAVAVRAGTARPDIGSEEAVRGAVLAARKVAYSTGPSGIYLEKLFARWGIADEIRPRLVVAPPGTPVGTLLARGAAELGFQQLSELIHLPGIDLLGTLPAAIQLMTTFSAGLSVTSQRTDDARALLAFMNAPAAEAVKRRNGMQPA
jgi:molybdate transport system substrate-binding protein